jgi:hypothetical protein
MTVPAPLHGPGAAWCLGFVERRCGEFVTAALADEAKPDETRPDEAEPAGAVLSLAELDLGGDAAAAADHELLAVLALRLRAQPDAAHDRLALRFVTSSASRVFGSRWLINDIPVPTPAGLDELALLVYRIRRTPRLERVVAAIENAIEALEVAGDDDDLVLGRAALERLEVLDDAADAAVAMSGRGLRFAERAGAARADRYLAVVGAAGQGGIEPLWLTDRKLHEGSDRASARPVTGKPYALLRLGARSTRQSVREFIDEIRRRHQRRPAEAATDQGESFARFVDRQLDKRRRELIEATYGHHKMYPVVTPIAVEAAGNLEGTVAFTDEAPSRFKKLIDGMRTSLQDSFGVKVPGIRVRLNDADLPQGTYIIMLDEVPLVSGNVDPGKLLCFAEPDALTRPPFDGTWTALDEATPPDGSGRPACWIPLERGDEVRAAGLETLDAAAHIELHLRSVLTANLDMFVTFDDIAERLPDAAGEGIRRARGGLARFIEVVRSLLLEALPITPLAVLAHRYLGSVEMPAVELAEALRAAPAVRERIAHGAASWTLLALSEDCEARIRGCVHREGDAAVLALEPELTQEILTAVRNEVGALPDGAQPAVVVEDGRLRPFVRNLLVLEFPRLRVVARRELDGVAGLPAPAATISVEP